MTIRGFAPWNPPYEPVRLPPMQFLPLPRFKFDQSMLNPAANARLALELFKRYEASPHSWRNYTTKEETMAGIELRAPVNPYRNRPETRARGEAGLDLGSGPYRTSFGQAPRRHDRTGGPGLLMSDMNMIARQHYTDGYAAAEREGERRVEQVEDRFVDVFDEGYIEGRKYRAAGLARDFATRLFGVQIGLMELRHGAGKRTRAKTVEAIEAVEAQLKEALDFAHAINADPAKALVDDPHTETG